MEVIAIAVQKGGTGKTTTAAVLAEAAAFYKKRCLAIDLDPQANLSFTLSAETGSKPGSYDLLQGSAADGLIQHVQPFLDVIPANWNLSTIKSSKGSARRLERALQPLKREYDLIIIDTPPTAGELQYNALQAATGLLIPLQADIYNLQSLYQITGTARQIQESNPALSIKGIILTQFNARSLIARQMQQTIQSQAEKAGIPYLGYVRSAVAVKEAAALQKSLFEYAPKSKPAQDYIAIYEKLFS